MAGQSRLPGQLTLRRLGAAHLLTPHFVTCCLLPAPTPARRRPSLPHGPAEQRKSTTGASPLAVRQISRSPLLPCENPVIDAPRSRRSKFLPELSSVFIPPLLHPAGPYSSPRCDKALSVSRRRGGQRPGVFLGSCPPVVRPDVDVGAAAEGLGGCRAAVGLRTVRLSQAVPGSLGCQTRGGTRQLWPKWKSETPGGKEPAGRCGTEMRAESHVELDSANELGTPGHGCPPEVPGESPAGRPLDLSPTEGSWGTWLSPPDAHPTDGGIVGHSRQVCGDVRQQPLETEAGTEGLYVPRSLSWRSVPMSSHGCGLMSYFSRSPP